MVATRVGVIGGGIAGPVVAALLKLKGYDPVIFERNETMSEAGIVVGVHKNGREVLRKIPGLLESLGGQKIERFQFYSVLPEDSGVLAELDDQKFRGEGGTWNGPIGVRRSDYQRALIQGAERTGVKIKWGHHLKSIDQAEDAVTLKFANGAQEVVSFVIGCDGLHSDTRKCLFGEQPADYTGLTQTGGYAPMPERLRGKAAALNVFGDGAHLLAVPVDEETMGFAVTQREPEAKETWRAMDAAAAEAFKSNSPVSRWNFGAGEIVRNATSITKYGLYDRPELQTWHQGRVILIGDAAHPTSPHLGQGGNLAMEDASMLVDLLEKHNPSAEPPSTAVLDAAFTELEVARIPRTAELVKRAREQGETRVVHGIQACIDRNNWYRKLLNDEKLLKQRFEH